MPATETIPALLKKLIACRYCEKAAEVAKRLPNRWKHHGDHYICGDCWTDRYVLRAVTLPVVSPVDLSWADLREVLKLLWRETTRASNYIVRELATRDVQREPGLAKMPPMPSSYLYPQVREQFPSLPPGTCASLAQSVTLKYKAKRYEVLWTCSAALPTFRYPQPLPVPNQAWSLDYQDHQPVLSVRLENRRVHLRLKSGTRFRRQLAAVSQIISGVAVQGECALYQQDDKLMAKLVAWLPRQQNSTSSEGVLRVRTAADSLFVALDDKAERLWVYHADQLPRWTAEHRRALQRWADDSKFEQRPLPLFSERRSEASVRYHRRINSAADQAAAYLVHYAKRRRYAQIKFDDQDHTFCPDFVWFRLKQRIQTLCDQAAIAFENASGQITETSASALAID